MPDLTIVVMSMCSDLEREHTFHINEYTQEFNSRLIQPTCTCPAYQFSKRPRWCKHLEEAQHLICTYHEQFDGPPKVEGVCPNCGKPTVYVRVGV
jgi:hypothetical protein